jgi:deoxyribodipyrimidine photo-lyase
MTSQDLRRDFANRDELFTYLRDQFPEAAAFDENVAPINGGHTYAAIALDSIDPLRYAATRNHLKGGVTRLSMYIRHGVLTLSGVRDAVFAKAGRQSDAAKLINELAWRDYWQRVYRAIGDGVWQDREAYKTGYAAHDYTEDLPDDIRAGATGLRCMDAFSHELRETGYLHNHARMWLAAYIVQWRRGRWQAGARWFLQHLLDGDPASNNLSWQWVASTFSHKPYIFNRENLERNTNGVYCHNCPLYGGCPFEGSYESLKDTLFPNVPDKIKREW